MSAPALALPHSLHQNKGVLDSPSHEDVAQFAYALWQERGSPFGSPEVDWLQAEHWLCGEPTERVLPNEENLTT